MKRLRKLEYRCEVCGWYRTFRGPGKCYRFFRAMRRHYSLDTK